MDNLCIKLATINTLIKLCFHLGVTLNSHYLICAITSLNYFLFERLFAEKIRIGHLCMKLGSKELAKRR
jgi:hypothetical protein